MGLLDRKGRKSASAPPAKVPTIQPDVAMAHPGALQLRAQLAQGQFEAALEAYRQLPTPSLREFHVYAATDERLLEGDDVPRWAHAFVEHHPDESVAWSIRGGLRIAAAWKARSSLRAQYVEESAWPIFFQGLNEAELDLVHATKLDPTDPAPWSKLLKSGRGLQISKEELGDRFVEAARRGDDLLFAHEQILQGLCAKWSGSHESMFQFAREASAASPGGSPLHVLVMDAHFEQWLDLDCKPSEYFFGGPDREVETAAQMSVLHPDFQDDLAHPYAAAARNVAAVVLAMSGARRQSWDQARLIGTRLNDWPWYNLGDPAERFAWVIDRGPG